VFYRKLRELLEIAIEMLPNDSQRRVLQLRFGLLDGRPRTLERLTQDYRPKRCSETVRRLLMDGLVSLKHVLAKMRLTDVVEQYMDEVV